jgi:phage shock protein PspC (stress-responsive transcriptional regulator)
MVTCPYCRTENESGAVRCRHCTSWMSQPPMQREWYRAREGKMIAGVCRGLSERFAVPLALTRVLFILSIFAGGWGIIVYIALWIAMPLPPLPMTVPPPVVAGPLVSPPPPPATSTQ